jgi:hypothetical protein
MLDVKNGTGHQLYEQTRSIRAKAKAENRPLSAEEVQQVQALERQQQQLYDEAYERSLQPTPDNSKATQSNLQSDQPRSNDANPLPIRERLSEYFRRL